MTNQEQDLVSEILQEHEESKSDIVVLNKKQNVILDSQVLSTLMACPRLGDFRFNHHFVSIHGKSKSLAMGSIVHKFLEVYYQTLINQIKRENAIGYGLIAAKEYAGSDDCRNCTDEQKEWALKTCELYVDFYKNEHRIPLEVEKVKGVLAYEDDEIRILYKAKTDLLFNNTQLTLPSDHKTYSQRRDTITLNNQFTGLCIVHGTNLVEVDKIGFQTSLEPKDKFQRVLLNYNEDRKEEWKNVILPYYAKLMIQYRETGYWPPNFTHCENKYGFCDFRKVCEESRNMREFTLSKDFIVGNPWDIINE